MAQKKSIPTLTKPLVLVGLMGAGKTTIGRRLAKRLEVPFKDSDQVVEEECHLSVADIFDIQGEEYFRKVERRVIKRLLNDGEPIVLATGGGAFMQDEIRRAIQRKGISIWLRADVDTLVDRVSRRNTRPLLAKGDKGAILNKLLEERGHVYSEADIVIDSSEGSHPTVVKRILEALEEHDG